jgi:hypothetical protein
MRELEKMLKKLLEDARKLPPGQNRHELLKDIGRLGVKIDTIQKRKKVRQAKWDRLSWFTATRIEQPSAIVTASSKALLERPLVSGMDKDVIAKMGGTCLLMRTRLISRVITGIYDEKLQPFGIGSAQFALLVVIYQIGPATRAEIGRFQHQNRSVLTRNLKVMLAEV